MRAVDLVQLLLEEAAVVVASQEGRGSDDVLDYKDHAASSSAAYFHVMEELSWEGINIRTRVPDGDSTPRAFLAWDSTDFCKEVGEHLAKWNRKRRKQRKMEILRYLDRSPSRRVHSC